MSENSTTPETEDNLYHVDQFIDEGPPDSVDDAVLGNASYARWILLHFRLPAVLQFEFEQFIQDRRLFCNYEDKRYRCIGASRLGDVWLTEDFNAKRGYSLRVDVSKCKHWSDKP